VTFQFAAVLLDLTRAVAALLLSTSNSQKRKAR
jgi:hypothetical protein